MFIVPWLRLYHLWEKRHLGVGKKEWGARDGERRVILVLYWFNMWEKNWLEVSDNEKHFFSF